MKILYLNSIDSTQKYILELFNSKVSTPPLAVYTYEQNCGIGSRNRVWDGYSGNLFLSFGLNLNELPNDLPKSSISIYFSYIFKDTLNSFGSKAWLKWPNDIYLDNKKIGGCITNIAGDIVVCGIGLNLLETKKYQNLDIKLDTKDFLDKFFTNLNNQIYWKDIFDKYNLEFNKSRDFYSSLEDSDEKVSLLNAKLLHDGSISINNKRVYSLR